MIEDKYMRLNINKKSRFESTDNRWNYIFLFFGTSYCHRHLQVTYYYFYNKVIILLIFFRTCYMISMLLKAELLSMQLWYGFNKICTKGGNIHLQPTKLNLPNIQTFVCICFIQFSGSGYHRVGIMWCIPKTIWTWVYNFFLIGK